MDVSGVIIQTSEESLLEQARNMSVNMKTPLVTLGTFFEEQLANSSQ
jgi:hypothetical protein